MTAKTDQPEMTITTMRIPTADYAALQEAAKEDDRSVSAVMRRMIREYLNTRNNPWLRRSSVDQDLAT